MIGLRIPRPHKASPAKTWKETGALFLLNNPVPPKEIMPLIFQVSGSLKLSITFLLFMAVVNNNGKVNKLLMKHNNRLNYKSENLRV